MPTRLAHVETETRSLWRSRSVRTFALAALMLLLLLRIPFSATHIGLGRDLFVAYRIVHGEGFPLYGPVLNNTIHLGPVWFYLLAGLLALGRGWLATLGLLGLLASMQIPLAYLLGKAVHSRRAGLLIALGLVVPSWMTFEWLLPSHPLLSAPCDLAVLLCAARYVRRPRARYFAGAALMFALAVHAHPSNVGLVVVPIGLALWAWRSGALRVGHVVAAGVAVLVPLLPFLYAELASGFGDLRHGIGYLGNSQATGATKNVLAIFAGVAWGGARVWFEPTIGWTPRWADLATGVLAAGGFAGAIGLAFLCRDARRRAALAAGIAATLAVFLTTAAIRADTPYYMADVGWVLLAVLVGVGLAAYGERTSAKVLRTAVAATAVLASALVLSGTASFQMRGAWPLAWLPLFDIKRPIDRDVDAAPLLSAYAQARSGRFLCSLPAPGLHGAYASQLLIDQGVSMRLGCARADVSIGGSESEREHWLGLSRNLLQQIGVPATRRIGALGLLPARPINTVPALTPPAQPVYPPLPPPPDAAAHALRTSLQAGEHLAVTNLAYGLALPPDVRVSIDGRRLEPVAHDTFTTIYACDGCLRGAPAALVVEVDGGAYQSIDAVVF